MTLGNKIGELRKQKGITQEDLAEQMGVTAQAVSKWENDQSCPDILLLPQLARFFKTTVDELLSDRAPDVVHMAEPPQPESVLEQPLVTVQIVVDTEDGDHLVLNIPAPMLHEGIEMGLGKKRQHWSGQKSLTDAVNPDILSRMIAAGVRGRLLEIDTEDGEHIEISVQ